MITFWVSSLSISGDLHFQGRCQIFSRGTHNFSNPSSPLSLYNNVVMLFTSTLLLFTHFFCTFPHWHSSVKKKKSIVFEKYFSKKHLDLDEKLSNIVLFKFIYFFQIIGIFHFILIYFLVSTFSGMHVHTVRTGSYASESASKNFGHQNSSFMQHNFGWDDSRATWLWTSWTTCTGYTN